MSVYIQQALSGLSQALDNLQTVSEQQEQKILEMQQQELFNGGGNDNRPAIDAGVLAQKLDSAIQQIEKVLAE